MDIKIDINNYLDQDEIKEAVREGVLLGARKHVETESNLRKILESAAYGVVIEAAGKLFDEPIIELMASKVKGVVEGLSSYTVFSRKDLFDRGNSHGYNLLSEVLDENRELLVDSVRKAFKDLTVPGANEHMKASIEQVVYEIVQDELFRKKEGE